MQWYSHQGGLSERDLREMEDEKTFWGMYESTDGWLCEANMADRAAGIKQGVLERLNVACVNVTIPADQWSPLPNKKQSSNMIFFLNQCINVKYTTIGWRNDVVNTDFTWMWFFFTLTSGGPRVWVPCALTHCTEELVDLLQGQGVVQCLQRIDGWHHGAAFKSCSRGEETWCPQACQPSEWPGSNTLKKPKPAIHHSTWCFDILLLHLNLLQPTYQLLCFISKQASCRNHAGHKHAVTPHHHVSSNPQFAKASQSK